MTVATPLLPAELTALPGARPGALLAPLTTLGVGGPADLLLETAEASVLAEALGAARGRIPVTVIGRGSNLVIADAGVRGLVVRWRGAEVVIDGDEMRVGSGLEHARAARHAADAGLAGLEFAAGIPGWVGGAVFNNAGAFGSEFRAVVRRLTGIGHDGAPVRITGEECAYGYRTSAFRRGELPPVVLTEAVLGLTADDPAAIRQRLGEIARTRRTTQPVKNRSVGSIFKNPSGDHSGRLIDAVGLKGLTRGRAQVSEEHANFIVNLGGASAADIRALVDEVRERVAERWGVSLEPEVEFMGDWE